MTTRLTGLITLTLLMAATARADVAANLGFASDYYYRGIFQALNGALADLIAITAEPLTPGPIVATTIGAVGGLLVVLSIVGLDKLKIDDPVGAISVHGVVGIWGVLAVCISNPDAKLGAQLLGIGAIFAWVFATSLIVWIVLKKTVGIRVSAQEEYEGVDISECGLEAYPEFTSVE